MELHGQAQGVEHAVGGGRADTRAIFRDGQLRIARRLREERKRDAAAGRKARPLRTAECRALLLLEQEELAALAAGR